MTTAYDDPFGGRPRSISLVSTYPPTRCGIGRFTYSLREAWTANAPDSAIGITRILAGPAASGTDPAVEAVFDPASPVARRSVARLLGSKDAVVLNHEYGLYGPDDGIAVLDLVSRIEAPLLVVVHTVRPEPTARQRTIIEELGRRARLVALSRVAKENLCASHDVDPGNVVVIPHGSAWQAITNRRPIRRRLITWGLLGPGKGIERTLEAIARIDVDPPVVYDIVGQTHPNVVARQGQSYRRKLERMVENLGLESRVRFTDRYVFDDELERMVADADVVVVPYDNREQVCSGVLTDAAAAGKPIVATAFPHAREFAALGCVIATDHDPSALAAAIERLLTDDHSYDLAALQARHLSRQLTWSGVADSYNALVESVARPRRPMMDQVI